MTSTPFRDTAKQIYSQMSNDYIMMQVGSDRARSHGWWRNLVEHGAWKGPGGNRVAPPSPDALKGIAKLFGTTVEQVEAMIAADWYNVHPDTEVSARALRLSSALDQLDESDAEMVETLVRRLSKG